MKTHELKTDPIVFDDVALGKKKFEMRYDDRNYAEGDELVLRRTKYTGAEMKNGAPLEYTAHPLHVYVTHVLSGPAYGLAAGWVCMSIEPRDGCA